MTKSKLIETLAKRARTEKIKSEVIVETVFNTIIRALVKNHRVEIRGFGSFMNKDYKAYDGRDPRDGRKVKVPERRIPFFKIGKEFKERLNSSKD